MNSDGLRILLVGNGGREHALAWKLVQSPSVSHVYVVPGNGGTAGLDKVTNVSSVSPDDFAALVTFAKEKDVKLLLPGPEAPLVAGVTDYFEQHASSIPCFGPSKAAARMEGSKTFSKDFMRKHNIPTAAYENFDNYDKAKQYLDTVKHNVVIKASGLAAGKGVILPTTKAEAHKALEGVMLDKEFGEAGDEVVIEEYLEGDEISILSFCDGQAISSLPPAQDHKRIFDGDQGPNTGGMGTYAPTRVASQAILDRIDAEVLRPTIDGMKKDGFPFTGCLFTGLMLTESGPKVLEYNVRFGDPETQSVLSLLDTDLADILIACTKGRLSDITLSISQRFAATVVVAAGGYPGSYQKGVEMKLDTLPEGAVLFHAGTSLTSGTLKTSGGRVIASTATGPTLDAAVQTAYEGVDAIHFDGMQYRKDIAHRALSTSAYTRSELAYTLVASGKIRDLYAVDDSTLLFVATDRISAYDVVMKNGIPQKGALLTLLSAHWFSFLQNSIPQLRNHLVTLDLPPKVANTSHAAQLRNRSMQVRRLRVFPIESIVRGYITGSAWSEYSKTGKVHGMDMPTGLKESEKLERPLWTPSTKAEMGDKDENISPAQAAEMVGAEYAKRIEAWSLDIYTKARDYALERGIIIADTKFEFALDETTDDVVLVDEVLTPDSSRFWPADVYEVGRSQPSLDKQYLRDWLTREGLKGKEGVELPREVVRKTFEGYREAYERIVGKKWDASS